MKHNLNISAELFPYGRADSEDCDTKSILWWTLPTEMLRLAENVCLSEPFAPDFYLKSVVL